jgi:hypothetical protein
MMKVFFWIIGTGSYLLLGLVWALRQWDAFEKGEVQFYQFERRRFMYFHQVVGDDIPEHLRFEWRQYVESNPRLKSVPPKLEDYQDRLVLNIVFWLFSMGFLVLQILYAATIKRLVAAYSSADSTIEQVRKDLK